MASPIMVDFTEHSGYNLNSIHCSVLSNWHFFRFSVNCYATESILIPFDTFKKPSLIHTVFHRVCGVKVIMLVT